MSLIQVEVVCDRGCIVAESRSRLLELVNAQYGNTASGRTGNIAVPVLNCQQTFATLQNSIQARNCGMICSFCMSCLSTDPQVSKSFSTLGAMLQKIFDSPARGSYG